MSNDSHSGEDAFGLPPRRSGRRFYFDFYDGERVTIDDTGTELQGLKEAQDQAVEALAEGTKDALPDGVRRDFIVEVRGETGAKLLRATLALKVEQLSQEEA